MTIFLVLLLGGLALSMVDFSGEDSGSSDGRDDGDRIDGSNGDDTLQGGDGDDTIFGNGGDDLILPEDGDNLARGGEGNDTIADYTPSEDERGDFDRFFGGPGADEIYGNNGSDELYGGTGNDIVSGTEHPEHSVPFADRPEEPDLVSGGFGADTLYGDDGDTLRGGEDGQDDTYIRVVYDAEDEIVTIEDYQRGEEIEIHAYVEDLVEFNEDGTVVTWYDQDGDDVLVGTEDRPLIRILDARLDEVDSDITYYLDLPRS